MCSTPSSLNTMVQAAKLRLLSTLPPPFHLSAKAGFHSTTGTHLRNYKTSVISWKLLASLQNLSKSTYLNIAFLVKKPNGGSRLMTSFGEVARYSKPQPSLMPNVDGVLREIGKWKYIVITDLPESFYQITLANSSMKYSGILPWECLGSKVALKN